MLQRKYNEEEKVETISTRNSISSRESRGDFLSCLALCFCSVNSDLKAGSFIRLAKTCYNNDFNLLLRSGQNTHLSISLTPPLLNSGLFLLSLPRCGCGGGDGSPALLELYRPGR
jgi:hypothetical protein